MKKFMYYYLPMASYVFITLTLFISQFMLKKAPESVGVHIEYVKNVYYYLTFIAILMYSFSYSIVFYGWVLNYLNNFFADNFRDKIWPQDIGDDIIERRKKTVLFSFHMIIVVTLFGTIFIL